MRLWIETGWNLEFMTLASGNASVRWNEIRWSRYCDVHVLFGTSWWLWNEFCVPPSYSSQAAATRWLDCPECYWMGIQLGRVQSFMTDRAARSCTASILSMLCAVWGYHTVDAYSNWGRPYVVLCHCFNPPRTVFDVAMNETIELSCNLLSYKHCWHVQCSSI